MSNEKIKFTVIIPCYNSSAFISHTVNDLIKAIEHYGESVEIVFINDGSTDDTLELINDLSSKLEYVQILNQDNAGVSAARNAGISKACGEYLLFLDSDDVYKHDIFSMLENVSSDVAFFSYEKVDSDGNIRKYKLNNTSSISSGIQLLNAFFNKEIYLNICALVVRKKLLVQESVLFSENIFHCEDLLFIISIIMKSQKIEFLDKTLFKYNFTPQSAVNSPVSEKHLSKITGFEILRKHISDSALFNSVLSSYDFFVSTTYILLLHSMITNGVTDVSIVKKYVSQSFILNRKCKLQYSKIGIVVFICKICNVILPAKIKVYLIDKIISWVHKSHV